MQKKNWPQMLYLQETNLLNWAVLLNRTGDVKTQLSYTGIIIYCNSSPIIWYHKRQNTVESSTLSLELIGLRIASESIISLRYKLCMFGIPVYGPCNVFCDNEAVYKNTSFAESTLRT